MGRVVMSLKGRDPEIFEERAQSLIMSTHRGVEGGLSDQQIINILNNLNIDEDSFNWNEHEGMISRFLVNHFMTCRKCDRASYNYLDNLERISPNKYKLHMLSSNRGLKYFGTHFVGAAQDTETGIIYVASPANEFNRDFSMPMIPDNTAAYDRLKTVITARSMREAMENLSMLEGGMWQVEEYFPYFRET